MTSLLYFFFIGGEDEPIVVPDGFNPERLRARFTITTELKTKLRITTELKTTMFVATELEATFER